LTTPYLRLSNSPTFSSKAARTGLMLADALDDDVLETRLRRLTDGYKKRFGDLLQYDVEEELSRLRVFFASPLSPIGKANFDKTQLVELRPYIIDEVPLLRSAKEQKAKILVEGAQAIMLDISYGTYPYVTSSNCSVGGILAGLSLDWRSIKEVIGVVKVNHAHSTTKMPSLTMFVGIHNPCRQVMLETIPFKPFSC
jgi:adenylosuccinate synthase